MPLWPHGHTCRTTERFQRIVKRAAIAKRYIPRRCLASSTFAPSFFSALRKVRLGQQSGHGNFSVPSLSGELEKRNGADGPNYDFGIDAHASHALRQSRIFAPAMVSIVRQPQWTGGCRVRLG